MQRPLLEVADVLRKVGAAWRGSQRGHLSLAQLKAMSAIEQCSTAALGGHVLRCEDCGTEQVSYNSCRNRHCPKCQSTAAKRWLTARQADLLPVEYYDVVFTLPAPIADLAYQNKAETLRPAVRRGRRGAASLRSASIWVHASVPRWCCTPEVRL